jgi:FkbM family methyltransferase
MKVLFIAPHLSTGGMPQYLYKQMEVLNESCEVWCIEWDNITGGVLVVQRNRVANLLGDKLITLGEPREKLFEYIEQIKPDVIHLQEIPEMFMPHNIALKLYDPNRQYKIVETSHDSSFDISNKKHFPDHFAMVSQYQVETYKPLNIPCELVEYPIEYKTKTKSREELLAELGLDPNKKHVINVGLFTSRKNQAEVVEYARQMQDYPIQFHFIGNQADNFKSYWEPIMKDFPPNCRWWGERNDVDTFYQMADLFLFTSRGHVNDKETMPLVIREAISWKVPSLIYNLEVYLNYFNKHNNIEYLDFNNKEKNIEKILNKLNIAMDTTNINQYFDLSIQPEENKITINYKRAESNSYKISIKEKDSNAPLYWFSVTFENYCSWWIVPTPTKSVNFATDPSIGTILVEFYDDSDNFLFSKDLFVKNVVGKEVRLNITNPFDCLFNNYKEMFLDNKYDCYELDKMETVFDIGANSGLFALLAIKKGAKKVYAFEPNQESLINLRQLVKDINVEVIDKAIYTKDEDLEFYIDPNNTTIGSISENHIRSNGSEVEKIIVPAISLKTFFNENNIERLSLLKMDIEGAEYDIIEALEDEIFEKVDNFLIEYHDNENEKVEKLIQTLMKKGFDIDQIRDQNTANNSSIMRSYKSAILGTIFAKRSANEIGSFNDSTESFLVNEVNINLNDLHNGHFAVQYKEVPYLKCPMDYVLYQMIIMAIKPDLIIEIGTYMGGGALYYADLLYLLGKGEVHTINLHNEIYDQRVFNHNQIKFFYGGFDNYDIEKNTKGFEKILVIDDGSHTYEDVLKSLNKFSKVVSKESYFIVEDGIVDFVGSSSTYNGGPRRAIDEFLQTNPNFIIDRKWCNYFGTNSTFNPDGYLKRIN